LGDALAYLPANPVFSGLRALSSRGFHAPVKHYMRLALQGVSEADNDESTKQWRSQLSPSAKSIFSGFSAMLSQGNNEQTTKAVHVARQGVSEAVNDESTKQWRRK
jgi:cation transport regulator ChaB